MRRLSRRGRRRGVRPRDRGEAVAASPARRGPAAPGHGDGWRRRTRFGRADPEQDTYRRELGFRLEAALDRLPIAQREAFVLCEVEELSSPRASEIAARPGSDDPDAPVSCAPPAARAAHRGAERMRRLPPSFDASVSAFREMTALPTDGDATRARVLARAGRDARRRSLLRRSALPLAIVLVIFGSGAALTAAGFRWRALAPAAIADATPEGRSIGGGGPAERPTRIVPAATAESPAVAPAGSLETASASPTSGHTARISSRDAPARALAAWDAYLAGYPRGTFAPEARYNRALCLARLGRFASAAEALRPFATGRVGRLPPPGGLPDAALAGRARRARRAGTALRRPRLSPAVAAGANLRGHARRALPPPRRPRGDGGRRRARRRRPGPARCRSASPPPR